MVSKDVICPYCEEIHISNVENVFTKRSTLRCRSCHKKFRITWMGYLVSTTKREDEKKIWDSLRKEISKESEKQLPLEVKCFCCGTIFETEHYEADSDHTAVSPVDGGLRFRATGNYGSTIFDPINCNNFLEIVICDKCVVDKKKDVKYIYNIRTTTTSEKKSFGEQDE